MSIELDMFLILAELQQDFVKEFISNNESYGIRFQAIENSKDFLALAVDKKINKVLWKITVYGSANGKYFVNMHDIEFVNESNLGSYSFFREIQDYLIKHNLLEINDKAMRNPTEVNFSKEELKLFGNVPEILGNIGNIKPIGSGGFRNVYDLGNYVLKIANNYNSIKDAIKQNKDEADSSLHRMFPDLTLKTFKHAPDYSWIIQEKAKPITLNDMAELLPGSDINTTFNIINNAIDLLKRPEFDENNKKEWAESGKKYKANMAEFGRLPNIIQRFAFFCIRSGTDLDDLKHQNFGVVYRNGKEFLVILDIGTHQISNPPKWEI